MSCESYGDISRPTLVLTRVRPERNERRFYALSIGADLFGNIYLFRNWGRLGTGGRLRMDFCSGAAEAASALTRLAQSKRRRGYEAWTSDPVIHQPCAMKDVSRFLKQRSPISETPGQQQGMFDSMLAAH